MGKIIYKDPILTIPSDIRNRTFTDLPIGGHFSITIWQNSAAQIARITISDYARFDGLYKQRLQFYAPAWPLYFSSYKFPILTDQIKIGIENPLGGTIDGEVIITFSEESMLGGMAEPAMLLLAYGDTFTIAASGASDLFDIPSQGFNSIIVVWSVETVTSATLRYYPMNVFFTGSHYPIQTVTTGNADQYELKDVTNKVRFSVKNNDAGAIATIQALAFGKFS